MNGIIRIITVTYLEDDIFEGSIPFESYENARQDEFEVDDVEEAIDVFTRHGLSFRASGSDWASDPDGSYVSNYSTGERSEVSGHFVSGFTPDEIAAIVAAVD